MKISEKIGFFKVNLILRIMLFGYNHSKIVRKAVNQKRDSEMDWFRKLLINQEKQGYVLKSVEFTGFSSVDEKPTWKIKKESMK